MASKCGHIVADLRAALHGGWRSTRDIGVRSFERHLAQPSSASGLNQDKDAVVTKLSAESIVVFLPEKDHEAWVMPDSALPTAKPNPQVPPLDFLWIEETSA